MDFKLATSGGASVPNLQTATATSTLGTSTNHIQIGPGLLPPPQQYQIFGVELALTYAAVGPTAGGTTNLTVQTNPGLEVLAYLNYGFNNTPVNLLSGPFSQSIYVPVPGLILPGNQALQMAWGNINVTGTFTAQASVVVYYNVI